MHERHGLRPGFAVLSGIVETEDGQPAIEVRVFETGRETRGKNGWFTAWSEQRRTVAARPFYLNLSTGGSLRVEPNDAIFLVDSLDLAERPSLQTRVRVARLDGGEAATVTGILRRGWDPRAASAGYRASGEALVLVPPRGERMLASVEPLEERHLHRARAHGKYAVMIAIAFVLTHAVFFFDLHASLFLGQVIDAEVTDTRTWVTKNKNTTTKHWGLVVDVPNRTDLERLETSRAAYDQVTRLRAQGQEARVPIRYVPGTSFVEVGERPTIGAGRFIAFLIALLIVGITYAAGVSASTPWYERKRLRETRSGRLQDN
jgi:hypothetical protein